MKIALVGAGRVASCMGPRLKQAGHTIAGVYSRTLEHAEELAALVGAPASDRLDRLPEADVYLIMLSDDALLQHASTIVKGREDSLFLHTAGSVPMDVFKEAGARHYGVLYAMQTFSKGIQVDWAQVPVFIEGSSKRELETVRSLALDLSPHVTPLSSTGRKKLHIAAVFTCNFTNHMYAISEQLLAEEGIPFSVMIPLVRETARKVENLSPAAAQTGPAVRGDLKVIREHLELLSEHPEYADIYQLLSTDINKEIK